MGLLRRSRLPFGIKTACHIFQRAIKIFIRKSGQHNNISRGYTPGSPHQREFKAEPVLLRLKQTVTRMNRDKFKLDCEKYLI